MLRACTTFLYALTAEAVRSNLKAERANAIGKVMDTVSSLLQRGNADDEVLSHLRALAGHSDAPDPSMPSDATATAALNGALTSVISEIEKNVLAKISTAHDQTQAALDRTMKELEESTNIAVNQKATADENDNHWFQCIQDEKTAREAIQTGEDLLKDAEAAQIQPCLEQDIAKKVSLDLTVTPFQCDISLDECDAELVAYQKEDLAALTSQIYSGVFATSFGYGIAKKGCDDAKSKVLARQNDLYSETGYVQQLRTQKTKCLTLHAPRKLAMCQFGTDLQNKCEKVRAHQTQMDLVNGAGNEFSHSDRVAEWGTTFKTKCLLQKIIEGQTLDATASDQCDEEAIYNEVLNKNEVAFAIQTGEKRFTCSELTISFGGKTWELPPDEEAPSEFYKIVVPYTRAVDIFAETPFAECAPTPTCLGDSKGAPCVFPFSFAGAEYTECTDAVFGFRWCATSEDFEQTGKGWGSCDCL